MMWVFALMIGIINGCIESRYPVYVCTAVGTEYYSPCMADIASNWIKVGTVCPKHVAYYSAECIEDMIRLNLSHITPHIRTGYYRVWWEHRVRPMTDIPILNGAYQSTYHSRAVKQDLLCIRSIQL